MDNSLTGNPVPELYVQLQKGIDWALKNKLALFALDRKPPRGKHLLTPEDKAQLFRWNKREFDPSFNIGKAPAFGINLGINDFVLDIDPRNYPEARDVFKELTLAANLPTGWETSYPVVQTPSGGYHIYMKLPEGFQTETVLIEKKMKIYPGLDFLSKRSFVLGPGSIMLNKGGSGGHNISDSSPTTYQVLVWFDQTPIAPPAILSLLSLKDSQKIVTADPVKDDDCVENIDAFKQTLVRTPYPVPGAYSDFFYQLGAKARDMGLSCSKATELIHDWQLIACGCDLADVNSRMRNAYAYACNTPGALAPSRYKNMWEAESNANLKNALKSVDPKLLGLFSIPQDLTEAEEDQIAYDPYVVTPDVTANGTPRKTLSSLMYYMIKEGFLGRMAYNEMSLEYEIVKSLPWRKEKDLQAWNEEDNAFYKQFVERSCSISFSDIILKQSLSIIAKYRSYHPIKEYLETLVWDGEQRLESWMSKYLKCVDTPYTRRAGELMLSAAVKRVYEPGVKFDYTVILEGKQRIGKSLCVEVLGGAWYASILLEPKNKETPQLLLGSWFVEVAEMEVFSRAEGRALKAFLTRSTDKVRLPYDRNFRQVARQSIFVGTINPEEGGYFTDTENTRYMPIEVGVNSRLDIDGLKKDRDQLFAEVVHLMRNNELKRIYFDQVKDDQLIAAHRTETEKRKAVDPWQDIIRDYFSSNIQINEVTMTDLLMSVLQLRVENLKRADQIRAGRALFALGWLKTTIKGREFFTRGFEDRLRCETLLAEAGDVLPGTKPKDTKNKDTNSLDILDSF